ncbi:nucleotide-diphospho-sugar transferase [Pelagophyceae sp. CCMP2097]|nr:nucleotide-diphospho-sugar transferase [Pelagophyceae sp. CCMP2097]
MPAEAASPPAEAAPARDALATLLYGGAFVDGARALGHSARKHSTRAVPFELVSLVTPDVAKKARTCLRRDGWRVLRVSERERPSALAGAPRLHGVYTKLELWGLTRYRRIVYVDADVAAFGSIDALFEFAGDFGAVLRHSELFNTGVLLITPDRPTAKKLRQAAETTFSYTGGDQGFLNEIHDLSKCPAARNGDATAAHDRRTQRRDRGCVRLESNFNGDWALDFARGFPCGAPALLHYSFGAAKPWTWVSAPFLPHVREWCGRRVYLPDECGPRVSANPDRTDEGSDKSPPGTAIAASGPRLWRAGGSLERASGARALKAAFKALLLKRSLKRSGKTRHQLRGELVGCKRSGRLGTNSEASSSDANGPRGTTTAPRRAPR